MDIIMTILITTTTVELLLIYVTYRDLDTNSMVSKYKLDLMYVYMCLAILNINFMCSMAFGYSDSIMFNAINLFTVMAIVYLVAFYIVPPWWYVKMYRNNDNVICYQMMMASLHKESTALCNDINTMVLYINETCSPKHKFIVKGLLFHLSSVDHVVTNLDLNFPNRENLVNHDIKAIILMLELLKGCTLKHQLKHSLLSENKHLTVNGLLLTLDKALNDFIEYNRL